MGKITKKKNITQRTLEEIYELSNQIALLKNELKEKENDLVVRLDEGQKVSGGNYGATIKVSSKVSPRWKEEYKELCSRSKLNFLLEENKIKAKTEPTTSRKVSIVKLL